METYDDNDKKDVKRGCKIGSHPNRRRSHSAIIGLWLYSMAKTLFAKSLSCAMRMYANVDGAQDMFVLGTSSALCRFSVQKSTSMSMLLLVFFLLSSILSPLTEGGHQVHTPIVVCVFVLAIRRCL